MINQVIARFSFISHYSAVSLLKAQKIPREKFSNHLVEKTSYIYPTLFKDRLKTEFSIIYERSDFRNIIGAVCLLQFIIEIREYIFRYL